MKTQRYILFFGLMSVLLAACASPANPSTRPTETVPPNDSDTPILTWTRNGGIAGFCDTVTVFISGTYVVENCSAKPPTRAGQLDAAQLKQLTDWFNMFQSFTDGDEDTTPTYPDQMFVKTVFRGNGSTPASTDQKLEISNFAGTLTVKAGPVSTVETPPAALKARDFLAAQLGISVDTITIVSAEAVEWSDSCMGLGGPEQICAQMITPGYKVMLEAGGKSYELHINESGDTVLLAP